jgi:hypothetical protein
MVSQIFDIDGNKEIIIVLKRNHKNFLKQDEDLNNYLLLVYDKENKMKVKQNLL